LVGLCSFWRTFQHVFGRSAGLASTAPEFDQIWIPLPLYVLFGVGGFL
jgi:hypothetical protein